MTEYEDGYKTGSDTDGIEIVGVAELLVKVIDKASNGRVMPSTNPIS